MQESILTYPSPTSSFEQKPIIQNKRSRDQYTDIDSLNKSDTHSEKDKLTANQSTGSRSAQSWNSLRAVVAYYCSLRKIKRNGSYYFNFFLFSLSFLSVKR